MISKAQIKYINSLRQKKYRTATRKFIVEGVKIAEEVLSSRFHIDALFATERWIADYSHLCRNLDITSISEQELQKISKLETPNEVLIIATFPLRHLPSAKGRLMLMLDNIQDPGNLGTIVRIADWFGIEDIICSEDTVDIYNPKAIQATMGSFIRVSCHYKRLDEYLGSVDKSVKIYGARLGAVSIYNKDLADTGIIIIGNESKGISPLIAEFITDSISIPSYPSNPLNKAESLNASVAAGIICSEFRRRKLF